jgi:hypothetical protein
MRTTLRTGTGLSTGIALSASGLALGGLALIGPSAAAAPSTTASTTTVSNTTGTATSGTTAAGTRKPDVCRYIVTAHSGLHVRETPGGRILGSLPHDDIVFADCTAHRGYVQLHGGVPKRFIGKYVYRKYLDRY